MIKILKNKYSLLIRPNQKMIREQTIWSMFETIQAILRLWIGPRLGKINFEPE